MSRIQVKDLHFRSLLYRLMAENEEQGREMRRLEMRIAELDVSRGVLEKKEDESEVITIRDIMKIDRSVLTPLRKRLTVWSPGVILCWEVVMLKNSLTGCLIFMMSVLI